MDKMKTRAIKNFNIILIIFFLVIFYFSSIASTYFLETQVREKSYLIDQYALVGAETANFIYILTESETNDNIHYVVKLGKNTNTILDMVIINTSDEYVNGTLLTDMASIQDSLYIVGFRYMLDPNGIESETVQPVEITINCDSFSISRRKYSDWRINYKPCYTELRINKTTGSIFLASQVLEYPGTSSAIFLSNLSFSTMAPFWTSVVCTSLGNERILLSDLDAYGGFMHLAYSYCDSTGNYFTCINKYSSSDGQLLLGRNFDTNQKINDYKINIAADINGIVMVEDKTSYTNDEADKMTIRCLTSNLDYRAHYNVPIESRIRYSQTKVVVFEDDFYVVTCRNKMKENGLDTLENNIMVLSGKRDITCVNKILITPPKDCETKMDLAPIPIFYSRDEVYLAQKNGIPTAQKRLMVVDNYFIFNQTINFAFKFLDFWIPKQTLRYINFNPNGWNMVSLGIEPPDPIGNFVELGNLGFPPVPVLCYSNGGGSYVYLTDPNEILLSFLGYWAFYQGEEPIKPVFGKEILYKEYDPIGGWYILGFGSFPGYVRYFTDNSLVYLQGYDMNTGGYYSTFVTKPNDGYWVAPCYDEFYFEVDQTEMEM